MSAAPRTHHLHGCPPQTKLHRTTQTLPQLAVSGACRVARRGTDTTNPYMIQMPGCEKKPNLSETFAALQTQRNRANRIARPFAPAGKPKQTLTSIFAF